MILKKLSGKNGNERFSERYFHFFPSDFAFFVFALGYELGLRFAFPTIDYTEAELGKAHLIAESSKSSSKCACKILI